jgi:hypothetical protein
MFRAFGVFCSGSALGRHLMMSDEDPFRIPVSSVAKRTKTPQRPSARSRCQKGSMPNARWVWWCVDRSQMDIPKPFPFVVIETRQSLDARDRRWSYQRGWHHSP